MTFEKKTTAFTVTLFSPFLCHNHCCQWVNLFSHKIVKIDTFAHCKGNLILCARWSVACAARLWHRQRLESSSSSSDTVCAKLAHRHSAGTQVLLETRTQAQCRHIGALEKKLAHRRSEKLHSGALQALQKEDLESNLHMGTHYIYALWHRCSHKHAAGTQAL